VRWWGCIGLSDVVSLTCLSAAHAPGDMLVVHQHPLPHSGKAPSGKRRKAKDRHSLAVYKERVAETILGDVSPEPEPRAGEPPGSTAHSRQVFPGLGVEKQAQCPLFGALGGGVLLAPPIAQQIRMLPSLDEVAQHGVSTTVPPGTPPAVLPWPTLPRATAFTRAMLLERALHLLGLLEDVLTPGCWQASALSPQTADGRHHPLLAPLVTHDGQSLCMPAQATRPGFKPHPQGYLQLVLGKGMRGRRVVEYAHRLVAWLFHGITKYTMRQCAHLCGRPNCLNPRHLAWVWPCTNSAMAKWHAQPGNLGIRYPHLDTRAKHPDEFDEARCDQLQAALQATAARRIKRPRGRPKTIGQGGG
jgi:hypothetical protein